MTKGIDKQLAAIVQMAVVLLVTVAIGQPALAQTPGLSGLSITSSLGTNSVDDAIQCTYTLNGSATTAAVAWYRNTQPAMTLYMPFEGGATVGLQDFSGRGMTPVAFGAPTWSATAGRGSTGAFQFAGSSYINAGNAFPTSSSYSVVLWAYPTSLVQTMVPLGSSAASSPGHSLRIGLDGKLTAGHNGNWRIVTTGTGEILINNWYLLGVTYDNTTHAMTLYKNGQPVDTAIVAPSEMVVNDATVQIGALQGIGLFRGTLDDVRIYNAVITPEQMAVLYAAGGQNRISSRENHVGDVWEARVTPFSSSAAGTTVASNDITIVATSPVITSTAVTAGIAGKKYSYEADATGGPRPTFSLLSGPTGMTIDAATGLVTWTATTEGSYPVSISADNSQGTNIQSYSITVVAPSVGVANVVISANAGGDLQSSNSLTLNATTSATAWLKNGQPLMSLFMPAEGGSKYALEDYSGSDRTPVAIGNPVWMPTGGRDGHGAWQFDGSSYIFAGNFFPLHSSYTKAAWIYHTVSGEFNHILSSWDHNITGTEGHGMRVSFDNRLSAGQNGDWRIVQSAAGAISQNRWYFAAVTFNYATSEMTLYIDGVPVDTTIVDAAHRDVSDAGVLVGATQGAFAWKGMLDDVRLYNYSLTPQQIQNLYTAGGSRILASDTQDGQTWQSQVTGFSSTEASVPFASNVLTIGVTNQPPVLATIGPRSVQETSTLTFTVSASDPDATVPTLSATPLPTNATFVDAHNGTGSFSFTPSYTQAGTYNIWFIASDGQAADSELVAITVSNLNRPPVLATIGSQTVAEGSVLSLLVSASDPDGDAMVMSTGTLPANANFVDGGSGQGTLTFAPSYLQAGIYNVWFRVFDPAMAGDSELVQITVTDTPQNALWLATFNVQGQTVGSAVTTADVQLGVQMSAQMSWASPAPPQYTAALAIRDADSGGPYFRDVRKFGGECYYWVLEIDPHGNVAPPTTSRCATLSWNPAEFSPDNNYVLRDGLGPNGAVLVADMRATTSYQLCDVQTPRYVTVHWESNACAGQSFATLSLSAGWNLISLPVTPSSLLLSDIIPTAEIAFEFSGSYHEVTTLQTGVGYWVKVPAATAVVLVGVPVTTVTSTLTTGWHLVGAPDCSATPQTVPLGALQEMFGFAGAYSPATQTTAGAGYWARISPDCTFDLVCAAPSPARPLAGAVATDSRLSIKAERLVNGLVGDAFVELGTGATSSSLDAPPEAPQYAVKLNLYRSEWNGPYYSDIRTASDNDNLWILAVNPCGNEGGTGSRTVVLSWDPSMMGDQKYELRAGSDGTGEVVIADMKTDTSVTVTGDNRDQFFSVVLTSTVADALPSQYELSQNYPNPFNPSTQISFGMPGSGHVRLEVLNILGQHVATLLDQNLGAGTHNITWEATDDGGHSVASGVYLYRLTVGEFSSVKKMVLLR